MRHGSLFSGVGGFDLAAEWMGWENVFHCEINPFGKKVLKYYWPKAISYDDITKTDFTIHRGRIDILSGGFPCQPFSVAGKRKGTEDSRNLWPEYYRAIREIQPTWVVGENVPGLINWSGGLVFEQVQADLEAEGYEVWPFILPACSVGAPHRRERIWFVAYRTNTRLESVRTEKIEFNGFRTTPDTTSQSSEWLRSEQREYSEQEQRQFGRNDSEVGSRTITNTGLFGQEINEQQTTRIEQCDKRIATDTESKRYEPFNESRTTEFPTQGKASLHGRSCNRHDQPTTWRNFPTQSPICSRNDGLSSQLVGITFPKHRNESIKAYGNAVVPPLVLQIFKSIQQYELTLKNKSL